MNEALDAYRDDGPLASVIGASGFARRLPWGLLALVGVGALVAALALQRWTLGPWTVAGGLAFVLLLAAARPGEHSLAWFTPPLLRLAEYSLFIMVAAASSPSARPAVYALLAAVAFHHYDIVYRLRHRNVAPPAWVRRAGLGWDGRMLLAIGLAMTSTVAVGAAVLAAWCGVLFVSESVTSWVGVDRATGRALVTATHEDDEA